MIPPKFSCAWDFFHNPWDADQHERCLKEGEVNGISVKEIEKILSETGLEITLKKKFMSDMNNLLLVKKKNN